MNVLLLLVTIMVSFIIVRAGAIAFELTGLERSIAIFQALSCFSGTGFTTRESEAIVSHPQRRRIATILIVLGNVGLVTMIATFANSLRPNIALGMLFKDFMPDFVPALLLPWVNLAVIAAAVFLIYRIFTRESVANWLRTKTRDRLIGRRLIKQTHIVETLIGGEYGTARVHIGKESNLAGMSLDNLNVRQTGIVPLMIIRGDQNLPEPVFETPLEDSDTLVCFGRLADIRSCFKPQA
ncbi:cation:proton antiporter regulatory subunit [Verrucomicrobiota bacterium]